MLLNAAAGAGPGGESEKGEVLLEGVGALRYVCSANASVHRN